jgi:hypothetical protein
MMDNRELNRFTGKREESKAGKRNAERKHTPLSPLASAYASRRGDFRGQTERKLSPLVRKYAG